MLKNLMPHTGKFFDFFDEHTKLIVEAARGVLNSASSGKKYNESKIIKDLEHKADEVTRQTMDELHRTFITPIDREQIQLLVTGMDDIIDSIDAVNDCFYVYKITKVLPDFIPLVELLVKSTEQVQKGVNALRNMSDPFAIKEIHQELYELEHQADQVYMKAIGRLFEDEDDAKMIIKWKDIYEIVELAIDQCAYVGDVLEGILVESS